MQYIKMGRSGLEVSRICLGGGTRLMGSWDASDPSQGEDPSMAYFRRALDLGINFFDTSPRYGDGAGEEAIGKHLIGAIPRHDLVINVKFGHPEPRLPNRSGLSRKNLLASLDESLRRLRTDHVDVFTIYRYDPSTPDEELMTALADIVRAGKARYIGCSTMLAYQFVRLQMLATANGLPRFILLTNLYHLLYREGERDLVPFCLEEGIGMVPYSPLARGILSGNRARDGGGESERGRTDSKRAGDQLSPESPAIVDNLIAVAERRGVKPSQIALAWLLQKPGVTAPVFGPSLLEHIDDAVAASDMILDPEEIASLEAPYRSRPWMN